MNSDMVNGLFELVGGLLLCLNVRRLWIDLKIEGVSMVPVFFFTAWGFWNLYFYPSVNALWSFWGGVVVVVVNVIYVGLYIAIYFVGIRCPDCCKSIKGHDPLTGNRCEECFMVALKEAVKQFDERKNNVKSL